MSDRRARERRPNPAGGLAESSGVSFPGSSRTDRSLAGTCSLMLSSPRVLFAVMLLSLAACHPDFKVGSFTTNEALYRAGLAEFQRGKWDNAVTVFEKLTADLPARDTLLPRSHWYLARAHQERREWVLAGTSFTRLVESFPDDTLADDAALEAARSYRRLWRRPQLDPTYGESADAAYATLFGLFPSSPLIETGRKEHAALQEMFAQKHYLSGMYYLRRKAHDSAIIYFKDVVSRYPEAPTARLAQLRLVDAYKSIRYKDDAADQCAELRRSFPNDAEVARTCVDVGPPAASTADSTKPTPPATGPPTR
jgi:outer membrane protein assembly factor BamD